VWLMVPAAVVRFPRSSRRWVFFGATGDLVYKKVFPVLQAMVKRGHLAVPLVGVARSRWTGGAAPGADWRLSLRRSSARHRRIPCRSTYGLRGRATGKTHVLPTHEGAISIGQEHSPNVIPLVASS
jgi:hypothetical protein